MFCECNSYKCAASLPLSNSEFLAAHNRHHGIVAVLIPGHEDPTDVIVERNDDFLVVRERR